MSTITVRSGGRESEILCTSGETLLDVLSSESFPHEIGLFLGYPLPDVLGYIQNRGKNSKLCGAWQVYGDAAEAERSFRRFRKCSELYKRRYNGGESLMQLTVSA